MYYDSFPQREQQIAQAHLLRRQAGPTLYTAVREAAVRWNRLTAIEFLGTTISYRDLLRSIDHCADCLTALGVKCGDVLALLTVNTPQAVFLLYAANKLGAVVQMLHPGISSQEIQASLALTNCRFLFFLDDLYPKLAPWIHNEKIQLIHAQIADAFPLILQPAIRMKAHSKPTKISNALSWKEFLKRPANSLLSSDACLDPNATALLLSSGGTTGAPKCVEITNENINSLAAKTASAGGIVDYARIRALIVLPLFHGFGVGSCLHTFLCNGAHAFLVPKYESEAVARLIVKKKVEVILGVPAIFEALIRTIDPHETNLRFIRVVCLAGESINVELLNRIKAWLESGGSAAIPLQSYGQTECTSGACIDAFFAPRFGSIGIPFPDNALGIFDSETLTEKEPGEDGEICVCSSTVMKGYYQNEAETAKVLIRHPDGRLWLHTGDIGYMDRDGYFYYRQRKTRMIICNGYNVYPSQVEKVLLETQLVQNAYVFGKDSKRETNLLIAVVACAAGDDEQKRIRLQLAAACRESLAEYAIPYKFVFVQEFPRTAVGKIDLEALQRIAR